MSSAKAKEIVRRHYEAHPPPPMSQALRHTLTEAFGPVEVPKKNRKAAA